MTTTDAPLIVSVSGIRGIVGQSLTPEIALTFARAFGTYLGGGAVAVSRDSRPSGAMFEAAVAAGLMSAGCEVRPLGIVPTPTVGVCIVRSGCAGGIQITASHNSAPYNGLKLFGPRGMVLTAAEGQEVLRIYESGAFSPLSWESAGVARPENLRADGARKLHAARVLELAPVQAIRQLAFPVLVDANHGAGGPLAVELLEQLGCKIHCLGMEPTGRFTHDPEPIEANLRGVAGIVKDRRCAIGFALDPDADRLALIDETGRYIGEELTLALATDYRLRQQKGPVVVNMSTSRVNEDIARKHGCPFHRAAVGEANVVEKMLAVAAVIGGEGNGGVIDPRVGLVRDPFIGMGLILGLMAESGKTLSQLAAELPVYHIVKDKAQVEREALPELYRRIQKHWPEAKVNVEDGLRLDWADRWLHVRPSNTEPIVRIIAEAPGRAEAEGLCRAVVAL